jgi:hypothetical protein
MGCIAAFDAAGTLLWKKRLYTVVYDQMRETDTQEIWLSTMDLVGRELVMVDERRQKWTLSIDQEGIDQ